MDSTRAQDPTLPPDLIGQVDRICDRFEAEWRAGRRPRIEEYLGAAPEPAGPELLRQLILLELDYRRRRGEVPRPEDYRWRFRELDPGWLAARTAAGPAQASRYQVGGEVGRGGMGVVFKGRDPDLGRELVIKVLREEYQDHPGMRRRFIGEAQIGGQLQHPSIVPVYELGWFPDRRPYFTMKLVEGRTLAALLAERADPAQDLPRFLSILEQVCQALAYAHSRGVIHRDLKPANVMVGPFGEVQVMDWGLAKVLGTGQGVALTRPPVSDGSVMATGGQETAEESRPTAPGQAMGTIPYMAPEQARGEVDRLDERCDVFGLGAMLCEILTGKPPFVGPDKFDRARRGDLAEVHARLDRCGADAELVRLTKSCLASKPELRPRDAGVVAGEVTAYLASVAERLRAAEVERGAAEARAEESKRTVAAERRGRRRAAWLTMAVLLVLTAGTAVSWAFYLDARRQTDVAKTKERDATLARKSAEEEKGKATRAKEELQTAVIEGILGTVGQEGALDTFDKWPAALDPSEIKALTTLSSLPGDDTRVRFIEKGLESAGTARSLGGRAEWVIQAAVGLDAERRRRVEEVLTRRLRDRTVPAEVKEACVRLGIPLEVRDPAFGPLAAEALVASVGQTNDPYAVGRLGRELSAVAARLDAAQAARLAEAFTVALARANYPSTAQATALQSVTGRLDAGRAAKVAHALLAAMTKSKSPAAHYLAAALPAVSARLDDAGAAKLAEALAVAIAEAHNLDDRVPLLASALQAVGGRLDAASAAQVAGALLPALVRSKNPFVRGSLAQALQSVGGRLDAAQAARVADALLPLIAKGPIHHELDPLTRAFEAAAGRLDAAGAARAADAILAGMTRSKNRDVLDALPRALQAVCARLNTAGAAKMADTLLAMAEGDAPSAERLAPALEAVAGRLDPAGADMAAPALVKTIAVMAKSNSLIVRNVPNRLAPALQAMAGRLDPAGAAKVSEGLLTALAEGTSEFPLRSLVKAVPAAAGRLDPAGTDKVARAALAITLTKSNNMTSSNLAAVLQAVCARLEAARAAHMADALLAAMARNTNPYALAPLARGLEAVGGRLDPAAAARIAEALLTARVGYPAHLLGPVLHSVGGRLDATGAARVADALLAALARIKDPSALYPLPMALQAVGGRLDAAGAARVADALLATMARGNRALADALVPALQAVAERLDTAGAGKVTHALLAARARGNQASVYHLASILPSVGGRLNAADAGRAADALLTTIATPAKGKAWGVADPRVVRGLRMLAGRLDATSAARVADALLAATANSYAPPPEVPQALQAVCARLDTARVLKVTDTLITALARTNDPRSVASRQQLPRQADSLAQSLHAVGELLTTPDLLRLLQHPLAAGRAQRTLLDVVGHRTRQTFRNTWHFLDWAQSNGVDLAPPTRIK